MGEAYWADFSFQINGGKSKKGFFSISRGVIFALIHFFGVLLARFFKKRNKKKKKEKRKNLPGSKRSFMDAKFWKKQKVIHHPLNLCR